jgi:DNA-binding IclR family transcriptional regulator
MKKTNTDHGAAERNPNTIGSIETMFTIVESLRSMREARITLLARETGFSKGTVHKHLNTLAQYGFVVKDGDHYKLGLRFLDYGGFVRVKYPGAQYMKEKTKVLADETDEIGFFTVEENGRPVILFREVGKNGVPTRSRVGQRLYLHQIAAGKAMLADFSEERILEIVEQHGLPRATENTITDIDELFEELEIIRGQGYALSIEEATEGLKAAGVTVTDRSGEVIGACAVAGPVYRMDDEYFEEVIPRLLRNVANELELSITYS